MRTELVATQFLDRARSQFGDQEAILTVDGERYTYAELGDRVDRLSAAFQELGIGKGDSVAVLDPNTRYHLETAYATLQCGAVHVPLNYRLTPDENEYILEDADVDLVVVDWDFVDNIDPVRSAVSTDQFLCTDTDRAETANQWQDVETLLEEAEQYEFDRPDIDESDIAAINYTSGTTGEPKGVVRNHRGETLHAYIASHELGLTSSDVYYWTLPMFHVNGWGHLFSITGAGARHICTRGVDVADVFDTIVAEDVSYLCAAPAVLNMLIQHYEEHDPQATGDRHVRIATGGSSPPEATIRTVEDEMGWTLIHLYGTTETGPLLTTSNYGRFIDGDADARFGVKKRQGLPLLGTELRVVDEDGTDVDQDDESVGEVVVRGNQIMERYRNKPGATEKAFNDRVDGWYHTGDLATVDDRGMIFIQDRKKDIIISGGENISSIQLEDVLYDHPAVQEVAVIPSPSDQWGETPKAFVVPSSGDPHNPETTAAELEAFTKEHLANYKAVRRVEFVETLPKTSTGKIQKYELRDAEWDEE